MLAKGKKLRCLREGKDATEMNLKKKGTWPWGEQTVGSNAPKKRFYSFWRVRAKVLEGKEAGLLTHLLEGGKISCPLDQGGKRLLLNTKGPKASQGGGKGNFLTGQTKQSGKLINLQRSPPGSCSSDLKAHKDPTVGSKPPGGSSRAMRV